MLDDEVKPGPVVWLLGLVTVTAIVWAYFPYRYLERSLRAFVNQQIPRKLHVSNLDLTGLTESSADVSVILNNRVLSLPLAVNLHPGWNTLTVDVRSRTDGFHATLELYDRKVSGTLDNFPLSEIFLNTTGSASGDFTLQLSGNSLDGDFFLTAETTDPIRPSPLIPPMLNGQTIKTFRCRGTFDDNVVASDDFVLETDQAYLEAHGSMTVKKPMRASFLNATLNLKWPAERTIKLNDTLGAIGLL